MNIKLQKAITPVLDLQCSIMFNGHYKQKLKRDKAVKQQSHRKKLRKHVSCFLKLFAYKQYEENVHNLFMKSRKVYCA